MLYAANNTLRDAAVSYTVTAYNAAGEGRTLAAGEWTAAANKTDTVMHMAEPAEPELWVIRWRMDGKEYANHFFTARADFETYRRWAAIIARECGFDGELRELK